MTEPSSDGDLDVRTSILSPVSKFIPLYTPAKFSVVLGGGAEAMAPLPFCAQELCFHEFARYKIRIGKHTVLTLFSPLLAETFEEFKNAGRLPLVEVVASSSALSAPSILKTKTAIRKLHDAIWVTGANDSSSPFIDFSSEIVDDHEAEELSNRTLNSTFNRRWANQTLNSTFNRTFGPMSKHTFWTFSQTFNWTSTPTFNGTFSPRLGWTFHKTFNGTLNQTFNEPFNQTFNGTSNRTSNQTSGKTFDETLQDIAASGVTAIADGSYTDNTGIVQAISAGATVVTSMVNSINDVWGLFRGEPFFHGAPTYVQGWRYSKIFDTNASEARGAFHNHSRCMQTDRMLTLNSLCFGIIHARTIHNKWLGIGSGVPITLKIINVDSRLEQNMLAVPTPELGVLVQEISMAIRNQSNN
eukprot:CAMPEP_0180415946 /NCGR_PEP_ID=MMETSP1036_2-20121128/201_1 /TAXON_ID=632150 /ORGANISM="Azadinium spinosum, Strain 3D9" /LENGTH=412 /DNA_ID=CAMNT_0022420803 /DNA_START=628 /DNA_END=1863 /DNA_ORIENTATION=+